MCLSSSAWSSLRARLAATHSAVSKIVALSKIASQLRLILLFDRSFKKFLSNAELSCNFFFGKTGPGNAEKASRLNLPMLFVIVKPQNTLRKHTALRSSSASLCFSPGSSKEDMSMSAMSAQSKLALVLAGGFHCGSSGGTAEGMATKKRFSP